MTTTLYQQPGALRPLSARLSGLCRRRRLTLRSFLGLLVLSMIPGTASALSVELLSVGRPDLIIPLVLLLEIPLAIWVSGILGADDRKTIKATFNTILSHDFSRMRTEEILAKIFWGEGSIAMFVFRIWLAVMAAMFCAITFGQIEPALRYRMEIPPLGILIFSFSLFSYVFFRNLCEETVRDQIGHACLAATFSGLVFSGFYALA